LIGRVKSSPVLDAMKMSMSGDEPLALQNVLGVLGEGRINIWLGVEIKNKEDVMDITLCFNPKETDGVTTLIHKHYPSIQFSMIKSVRIISVFPFRDNADVAFRFIKALEDNSVPMFVLSTSLSSISCVVPQAYCSIAIQSLETTFGNS
jgi:aspartokinase